MLSGGSRPGGEPIVTHSIVAQSTANAIPQGGNVGTTGTITPAQIRGAYGLGTYGSSNVTFGSVQGTGAGQTIALVEEAADPDIAADLAGFDSYWSLPAPPSFQQLNSTGGTSLPFADSDVVSELDLDVEWSHVMAPLANIVLFDGDNLYTAITTAENYPGVSVISVSYGIPGVEAMSEFLTPSGHPGVTVTASAGDTGGEVVDPSMSPAVVAVGGTTLSISGTNYVNESAWGRGGGGISSEAQPAYQNGVVSAFSSTKRTVPDVSLDADYVSGVAVYDIYNDGTSAPWDVGVGGTSLSSPLMAGIIAVADQGRAVAGLTSLDGYTQTLPRLYRLPSADFHDITSGSNTHAAGPGYDLATGIGSPVANKLIPDLAGAGTVTGEVYTDLNGNGLLDGLDTPLANQTVYLDLNESGVQTASDPTAVTNSSGSYTFSDQIGSETGIVRLASLPSGDLHSSAAASFITSYNQVQTINIGVFATAYTVVTNPSTVTTTKTALSLSGQNPSNSASFTYLWSVSSAPTGGTAVFSLNGTTAAASTIATFNESGAYTFTVKISDGQGATVSVVSGTVMVSQVLSTIALTPATASVPDTGAVQVSATGYDQFGNALTAQPTFSYSVLNGGLGSVNALGLYSAPASGSGFATVQAASGTVTGTSTITICSNTILGTSGDDTIRLVRSGANELIYVNNSSNPAFNVSFASIGTLTIASGTGTDSVNFDFSGGATPVPPGGIIVNSGVATGNDTLIVTGTSISDNANISATTITFDGSIITYSNINAIVINGNFGNDSLTQNAQPGNNATLTFNSGIVGGPSLNDVLNVKVGSFVFPAPAAKSGVQPLSIGSLSVSPGASVAVGTAVSHSDRYVVTLGSVVVAGATLDLGGNDMISRFGNLTTLTQALASGSNNGSWNGLGISSSAAAGNLTHLTALAILSNTDGLGELSYALFDGQPVSATDILIKYTYIGDTNLDGQVDGSDYSKIDNGFVMGLTGWSNGDLNFDGQIDGSDYALIDNSFNSQGVSLAAAVATPQTVVKAVTAMTAVQNRKTAVQPLRASVLPVTSAFASAASISWPSANDSSLSFWNWFEKPAVGSWYPVRA